MGPKLGHREPGQHLRDTYRNQHQDRLPGAPGRPWGAVSQQQHFDIVCGVSNGGWAIVRCTAGYVTASLASTH